MKFFISPKKIIIVCIISLIIFVAVIYAGRSPLSVEQLNKIFPPFAFTHKKELRLTFHKTFLKCKHTEVSQKIFDSEKALNVYKRSGAFARMNVNVDQNQKANKSSYYTCRSEGFCETCEKNRFMGIIDKEVVVYYGIPEKPGPVQEKTGIDLCKLPETEVLDLKEGIPLKDEKEKLQLIEGLRSLFTN